MAHRTPLGENAEWIDRVLKLYDTHADSIRRVRGRMEAHYKSLPIRAQFDDIEAEITCLLSFDRKPGAIIEFSPCGGWSTAWILESLGEQKIDCRVTSIDLITDAINNMKHISLVRWLHGRGGAKKFNIILSAGITRMAHLGERQ